MISATPRDIQDKQTARWHAIYDSLREAIISHRIGPGTKLPEDELASIYSVSRTVIRVALHALAHDRLVRLELNRGAFVAQPSIKEARDVFEARALIEPEVARIAAQAIRPKDLSPLKQKIELESQAWRAFQRGEAIQLAGQFHIGIAELANHSVLTQMVKDLVAHSSLIQSLYWKRGDAPLNGPHHLDILAALERRAGAEAAELMKQHIGALTQALDLNPQRPQPIKLADILA